ncbi:hypothetical protein SNE40_018238 [Patella caerulea]|uniref:OTU domain-containing protein n=1 Tax=Patella caerulea TaxID=87958 RepID=A0AAN8J7B8_PATCE
MRKAAKQERLFNAEFPRIESSSAAGNSTNLSARVLLHRYLPVLQCNPLKTSGDKNCLFNAVSILLQGDEKLSVALRYLSCLTLIENKQFYKKHRIFKAAQSVTNLFNCRNVQI